MDISPSPEGPTRPKRIFNDIGPGRSIIMGVFAMITCFLLAFMFYLPKSNDIAMIEGGHSVTGVVTKITSKQGFVSAGRGSKKPVTFETITVEYAFSGSKIHTFEGEGVFWPRKDKAAIGSEITVYYNVDKPDKSVVEGYERSGKLAGFFIFVAIFLPFLLFLNALPDKWYKER